MTIILVPFFVFSLEPFGVPFLIALASAILGTVGTVEYFRCIGLGRDFVLLIPPCLFTAILPFLSVPFKFPFDFPKYGEGDALEFLLIPAALFFLYLFYVFAVAVFRGGKMPFSLVAEAYLGALYIGFSFTMFTLLFHQTTGGAYIFLLAFIGPWTTDIFAYLTGRLLGKHKLAPVISPKKTVEGSIGGTVFCMIVFVGYGLVLTFGFDTEVNFVMLVIAGLLCAFISQVGDLILSLVKREHGIKDYGKLFPGHGGVLDRFDSVIATVPVLLFLASLGDIFPDLSLIV